MGGPWPSATLSYSVLFRSIPFYSVLFRFIPTFGIDNLDYVALSMSCSDGWSVAQRYSALFRLLGSTISTTWRRAAQMGGPWPSASLPYSVLFRPIPCYSVLSRSIPFYSDFWD